MSNFDCYGAPKAYEDFDLKHILQVAKQILVRRDGLGQYGPSNNGFFTGIMDQYGSTISDVSREMTCKLSESADEKTYKILKGTLGNYSWKAKMVLAVAAFALKCGKHLIIPSELANWRDLQSLLSRKNPIIKSIWLLQRLDILCDKMDESSDKVRWLETLVPVVRHMTKLTGSILDEVIDQNSEDEVVAAIQLIIKSAVVCSSQITVAHLLLLSNRERLFHIYASKLDELGTTLKKALEASQRRREVGNTELKLSSTSDGNRF